jgi:D-glycero-D-manno-heptose 1,7-bisphosphate phosphatase
MSKSLKPAVFLDRDGTLIEEVNFLSGVEDLRFFAYTDRAILQLKESGYLVIVVTNQSGIGRGYFSEAEMHLTHDAIQQHLTEKIDAFYFCPHLPDAGCECRKPAPGMIRQACADFDIDLENSWMVGDKALDVRLGLGLKMKTALVLTGYGKSHRATLEVNPDLVADNLLDAVENILGRS